MAEFVGFALYNGEFVGAPYVYTKENTAFEAQ